jgi:hypothetical protein
MLGGARRRWPSLAVFLLSAQHRAHRQGDMARVWTIRRLRSRIQMRMSAAREESLLSGMPFRPLTDEECLAEMHAEREEAAEELAQCRRWHRRGRAHELEQELGVIDDVLAAAAGVNGGAVAKLDTEAQNHDNSG